MGSLCMLQLTQKYFASSSMCSLRALVDDGAGASLTMPDLLSSSPGLAEHFDHQSPEEGEHVASNVPNRTVLTLLGALRASGSFDFAAYWRTTTVAVVANAALSSGSVSVENRWGSSASVEFTC